MEEGATEELGDGEMERMGDGERGRLCDYARERRDQRFPVIPVRCNILINKPLQ